MLDVRIHHRNAGSSSLSETLNSNNNDEERSFSPDNYNNKNKFREGNDEDNGGISSHDALYAERYKRRFEENQRRIQQELERVSLPNPIHVDPTQFIQTLLSTLRESHYPYPYFGYKNLLSTSTFKWQQTLLKSVGAPAPSSSSNKNDSSRESEHEDDDDMLWMTASIALGNALERPNNQFGILVGASEDDGIPPRTDGNGLQQDSYNAYTMTFPTDPILDEDEGTCWLECRLYSSSSSKDNQQHEENSELLVVMGWSLCWMNDAWYVDNLDWQDFRDKYRPGIGREEWERICG